MRFFRAIKEDRPYSDVYPNVSVGELFYADDKALKNEDGIYVCGIDAPYVKQFFVEVELPEMSSGTNMKFADGDLVHKDDSQKTFKVLGGSETDHGDMVYHLKSGDGEIAFVIESKLTAVPEVELSVGPDKTVVVTEKSDMVNNPDHYTVGGIESLAVIKAKLTPEQYEGFLLGNMLKYGMRANFKGDFEEDVSKARFYNNELVEVRNERG